MKTALAVLVLTLAPAVAFAECNYGKHQQAASCAAGSSWDSSAGACVPDANA